MVKKYYLVAIGVIILSIFIILNMNGNENEIIFEPINNKNNDFGLQGIPYSVKHEDVAVDTTFFFNYCVH